MGLLDGDTAVMDEPVTAEAAPEPPPPDVAPETEQAGSPETLGTSEAPETEQTPADPLDALDEEALTASPRVKALLEARQKDLEARHNESLRRTKEQLERDAQGRREAELARINYQHAQQVQSGETYRRLEKLVKDAVEEGRDVTPEAIRQAATELAAFHSTNAIGALTASFNQQLSRFENPFEGAADLVAEYNRAETRGDAQTMTAIGSRIIESAIRADERAKALAEFQKDIDEKAKQEPEVEQLRKAEAARKAQQSPTKVSGAPGTRYLTRAELDAKYTDQQWAELPMAERRRLNEEADLAWAQAQKAR